MCMDGLSSEDISIGCFKMQSRDRISLTMRELRATYTNSTTRATSDQVENPSVLHCCNTLITVHCAEANGFLLLFRPRCVGLTITTSECWAQHRRDYD